MWLFEVVGSFHFNGRPFARADVIALQRHGVPRRTLLCPLLQRTQQYLLAILFQVCLPFKLNQFEGMKELIVRLQEMRRSIVTVAGLTPSGG